MIGILPASEYTPVQRKYVVGGRGGYYAIDEHDHTGCLGLVYTFKTRKQAESTANDLSSAYYNGFRDAHVGLMMPLMFEHLHRTYHPETSTIIPAGTVVKVIGKDGPAFLKCAVVDTGLEISVTLEDLRGEVPGVN